MASSVRIKSLQSAKPILDEKFDEFQFVVDAPNPDSTLKLSGAELKEAIGVQNHTHSIEDISQLSGALENKFDKAGGLVTGNMSVDGNIRAKSVAIEEYLEVPEWKYNRITVTGNELWVTNAGVVDTIWKDIDGVYIVTLKSKEGETTINFQFKDILKGKFYTTNPDGSSAGFKLAYFEVTGIIDDMTFGCISLNNVPPEKFMTLARCGNKVDPSRQGSVYLDGIDRTIRVLDGITDDQINTGNIRAQIGNLDGINHPIFGQLSGFGALLENTYVSGRLVQHNPETGEDWAVGAVSVTGEQVFHYNASGIPSPEEITLSATEQGFSSIPEFRQWQYKDDSGWITLDSQQALTYALRHDAEIWGDRKTLTLRYCVANVYYDVITVSKVYNGEDNISVLISSTAGNQFVGGVISTVLKASVYKGFQDVTPTILPNAFSWFRSSDNPEGDAVWNSLHEAIGSEVAIDNDDVYRKAVFSCEVNIS